MAFLLCMIDEITILVLWYHRQRQEAELISACLHHSSVAWLDISVVTTGSPSSFHSMIPPLRLITL